MNENWILKSQFVTSRISYQNLIFKKAIELTNITLNEVKSVIGINYFNDNTFYEKYIK